MSQGAATRHLDATLAALELLRADLTRLQDWGSILATTLATGGRLLSAGNGGSAAHAQHLASELVGRYDTERRPLSAIALCAETTGLTAIVNDYGADVMFARQVVAHGRVGDVFVAFSTSGKSENVLRAAQTARACGLRTWAFTGTAPNPLAASVDDVVAVAAPSTATVQEIHQVGLHLLCEAIDEALPAREYQRPLEWCPAWT
jgi:D-sedoheptulose 7-phosphate isomerase